MALPKVGRLAYAEITRHQRRDNYERIAAVEARLL
jgi:hypothetical protein